MTSGFLPVAGVAALIGLLCCGVAAAQTAPPPAAPPPAASPATSAGEAAAPHAIVATLEQVGFFGTWAARCGEPAGLRNPTRNTYVSAAGEPGFSESVGADLPENVYRIVAAARDGDNQIVLDVEFNYQTAQRLTMVLDRDRIRTLTNALPDGRLLVRNGAVVATGSKTPWLKRCQKAPASDE